MKKVLIAILCALLATSMVGCAARINTIGNSTNSTDVQTEEKKPETPKPPKADPSDLEIIESGWSVTEDGYVQYGIGIKNPNKDYEARLFTITVSGKDENGKILFSEYSVIGSVFPNGEYYFGTQVGNGLAPTSLDFIISVSENNWVESSDQSTSRFVISNTNEIPGDYGLVSFTGEISTTDKSATGGVFLSLVFRNKEGKIIGGSNGFTDIATTNTKYPFEVRTFSPVEHDKYDIFAYVYK